MTLVYRCSLIFVNSFPLRSELAKRNAKMNNAYGDKMVIAIDGKFFSFRMVMIIF